MNTDPEALFRSLADPTRLRCLVLLHGLGELCVCELTHALEESQPKISRHLAQLRRAGLVEDRREGLWIHYRLNPGLPGWVQAVLTQTAAGLNAQAPYRGDRERLATMAGRPPARCAV
jgi:ArsR family transcriptional regulator